GHTQRYTPGWYSALRCSVSGCSVSGRPVLVLSVSGEFPAQRRMDPGARLVQADDLDGLPAARVLRLDGVQGGDGRGVPDVRGGKVDDDPVGVGRVVEAADEVVGGREEQLARPRPG